MARISVGSSAFVLGAYASSPVPLEKVLDHVRDAGFQGLELFGSSPHGDPDAFPSRGDRRALVRKLRDHGLSLSNYGADFGGKSPASNDPHIRREYKELFERNLQFCVDCEAPSIRVDTVDEPPLPRGVSHADAWRRFVEMWQECSERAQAEGVLVVWEFEPGFSFNRPSEIVRMVRDVAHSNFKVLFDACHAHMCASRGARQGEPAETLSGGEQELARCLAGNIGYVHLIDSDNTLHDGWTSTHAPFGSGFIDFDALAESIIASGYSGDWWTVDLCFWPKAWDILLESRQFVEALLLRHGLPAATTRGLKEDRE